MVLKHISEQLPRRRSRGVFGVTLRGRRANPSGGLPRVRIDTIKLAVRAQFRPLEFREVHLRERRRKQDSTGPAHVTVL